MQALPKQQRGPDQLPARFIELIGKLYHVEAIARRDQLDANARKQLRQDSSVPVLAEIEALLLRHLHSVLPSSLLGKALHYTASQWPKLARFVEDGNYPIDNNACENAIRPFCVGRRNWLFSDTVVALFGDGRITQLPGGIEEYLARYRPVPALVAAPPATTPPTKPSTPTTASAS